MQKSGFRRKQYDSCGPPLLWHSTLNGSISNGPITYELDGRQFVVAAAGDTLWTFVLNTAPGKHAS